MTPVCPVCHKQLSGNFGPSPGRICYRCGTMFIAQNDIDKIMRNRDLRLSREGGLMKIYTVWERSEDPKELPWLVTAIDEYTIDDGGAPESYLQALGENRHLRRQLIINIPEAAVTHLFAVPEVPGKVHE